MALDMMTLRERADLRAAIFADAMQLALWPEFMRHDPVAGLYFGDAALDRYLDFVLVGLDGSEVVARAFSVPFCFGIEARTELPDAGWGGTRRRGREAALPG